MTSSVTDSSSSSDSSGSPGSLERMALRNPDAARILRANLAVYARRSDDPKVRDLVADVLAGRRDRGEVLTSKAFNEVGGRHLDNLLAGIDALEPEEKELAFDRSGDDTSEAELARLRDAAAPGDGWASEDSAPVGDPFTAKLHRGDKPIRQTGGFLR